MRENLRRKFEEKKRREVNELVRDLTNVAGDIDAADEYDDLIKETAIVDNKGQEMPPKRRRAHSKYNISSKEARTYKNIVFDSKWEMESYVWLETRVKPEHLHLQPNFILQPKFYDDTGKLQRSIQYRSDFLLGPERTDSNAFLTDEQLVIDCKGVHMPIFKLKEKLFMYRYGRKILLAATGKINELEIALAEYQRRNGIVNV